MSDLKKQLIRLGSTNPELRPHIREVLAADAGHLQGRIHAAVESFLVDSLKEVATALKAYGIRTELKVGPSSHHTVILQGKAIKGHGLQITAYGNGSPPSFDLQFKEDRFADLRLGSLTGSLHLSPRQQANKILAVVSNLTGWR